MRRLSVMLFLLIFTDVFAKQVIVNMYLNEDGNKRIRVGTIIAQDTEYGLLLKPNLHKLKTGTYFFHIYDKPKCGRLANFAEGYLEPGKTGLYFGKHSIFGQWGDLPNLYVDNNGSALTPILSTKLKVSDILKRSLVVYSEPDNYAEKPRGNVCARIICGVVPRRSHEHRKEKNYPEMQIIN